MIRQYDLVERVKSYYPAVDESLLNRAYVYAMKMHGSQKRASGDPYFSHPLEVAGILTDLKLDPATIVTALLHDTIEDTEATHEEIARLFGEEIAQLVDGVTKLTRLELTNEDSKQAENFRKLILAVAKDVRVLLVKLADRLHNMRTLEHIRKPESRRRIAQETMDLYAPLAGRMGMQGFRDQLEDLAFAELNPEARDAVKSRLDLKQEKSRDLVVRIADEIKRRLAAVGIEAWVSGRTKTAYSIWKKMERKSIALEQLSDIYGFRVVVDSVDDCYRALGILHGAWPMVPGRFKDYISTPKGNNYRSIHTTVVGPERERVEMQIRTLEMHEVDEFGVAAHWFYKDYVENGSKKSVSASDELVAPFRWLREVVEMLEHDATSEEFLEHTKLEMFQDQVFCFTPKGRLIALPRGATPIDFAYAVHTDIGDRCVGAMVNGRHMALRSELQNGDEVEIMATGQQVPPLSWDDIVVTGKARAAIRAHRRRAEREQYVRLGRGIVEASLRTEGLPVDEAALEVVVHDLPASTLESLFEQVGRATLNVETVVRAMLVHFTPEKKSRRPKIKGAKVAAGSERAREDGTLPRGRPDAIPITGAGVGTSVTLSPVSLPIPGDRIVGIMQPGKGVEVYRIDSPALAAYDDDLDCWIAVKWDIDADEHRQFPARIALVLANAPGVLGEVATVAGKHGANIENLTTTDRKPDVYEMTVDIGVESAQHLERLLTGLRGLKSVSSAKRVYG
ncbi:bifunctional (p)ppGpp synthetase/guanosine-3',5'-bis(diphosphate) 3'-pyrophosphohydrolase [Pyruvatibacter sp.]|uniref:RelA/SpoT family protein n=1 Tax=Pyruvatibacter sp. TaxID=1981328 RepID=UPI0032EB20DD